MAQKTSSDEKLQNVDFDLFGALAALDKKDYSYWNKLTEEQRKKFVPWMILHWHSAVKAENMIGSYYTISTDINANKHMFNEYVQKHPELQWLMLCTVSPGLGKQFHQWLPHLNTGITNFKTPAKEREVLEYFQKIYKTQDKSVLQELAVAYTQDQNHKTRLAKHLVQMKLDDIETLSKLVSPEELNTYEKQCGIDN